MLCEALSTHSGLSQAEGCAECEDSTSKKQHQHLQSRGRAGQSGPAQVSARAVGLAAESP